MDLYLHYVHVHIACGEQTIFGSSSGYINMLPLQAPALAIKLQDMKQGL